MFDVAMTFLGQLVDLIPPFFGIYLLFDFLGSLLFGKNQEVNMIILISIILLFFVIVSVCLSYLVIKLKKENDYLFESILWGDLTK